MVFKKIHTYLKRNNSVKNEIVKVASNFENPEAFTEQAKESAELLGSASISQLVKYFHNNPDEPEALKSVTAKYGVFGVWMNICQNAIFEILYYFEEDSVRKLNEIAFGEYDWTQYKAIDILCRLANEGVQKDLFLNRIEQEIGDFRWEAYIPTLYSLAKMKDDRVKKIFIAELQICIEDDDFSSFIEILEPWMVETRTELPEHNPVLKNIALGKQTVGESQTIENQENYQIYALSLYSYVEDFKDEYRVEMQRLKNETTNENVLSIISEIENRISSGNR